MDWFLYDNGLRHERVKHQSCHHVGISQLICGANDDLSVYWVESNSSWKIMLCITNAIKLVKSYWSIRYMMLCTICYHLHNFKNVRNTHRGVLLLVKLQASATFKLYKLYQIIAQNVIYPSFKLFPLEPRLALSWRRSLSYRIQTIDFQNKSMDWFLYFMKLLINFRNLSR